MTKPPFFYEPHLIDYSMASPNCHLSSTPLSAEAVKELEAVAETIKDEELSNVMTSRLPGKPPSLLDMWNNQKLADQIPDISKELGCSEASLCGALYIGLLTCSRKIALLRIS